jgi:hypothetical protein
MNNFSNRHEIALDGLGSWGRPQGSSRFYQLTNTNNLTTAERVESNTDYGIKVVTFDGYIYASLYRCFAIDINIRELIGADDFIVKSIQQHQVQLDHCQSLSLHMNGAVIRIQLNSMKLTPQQNHHVDHMAIVVGRLDAF